MTYIVIRYVNWFENDIALIGYSFCAAIATSDSDSDYDSGGSGGGTLNDTVAMETVAVTVLVRFSMAGAVAVGIESTIKVDEFASETASDSDLQFSSCYFSQW